MAVAVAMAVAVVVAAVVAAVVRWPQKGHIRDTTGLSLSVAVAVVVVLLFGCLLSKQGNTLRTSFVPSRSAVIHACRMEPIVAENCNISHAGTDSNFQVFGSPLISETQWLCGLPSDWYVFTHSV